MGDGESPGLTADAELNYYRLRSGIDKITAQVNYLQEYIRTRNAFDDSDNFTQSSFTSGSVDQGGDHFWSECRIKYLIADA